jgi:general L-amino acid transport system permease protein
VTAIWRNRRVRLFLYQAAFVAALVGAVALAWGTTAENLARRHIGLGFAFLDREAGFSLGETPPLPVLDARAALFAFVVVVSLGLAAIMRRIAAARGAAATLALVAAFALVVLAANRLVAPEVVSFAADRSFLLAIATGLANTIKVAALGIVLASVVGFLVGIARMAANPLVRGTATVYVELFRNVPLLIQIFFWYFAVLRALPGVRASIDILGVAAVNNRGIYLPRLVPGDGAPELIAAALAAIVAAGAIAAVRRRRSARAAAIVLAASGCAALLAATRAAASVPFALEYPHLVGFNFEGGTVVSPEYGALLLGLTLYSAAYIAEIVRSGLGGIGRGQRDAAQALGFDRIQTLRLVVVPQALRIAIPPLISQYLSLTKDSSLGIAIGYPEIVSVTGQVINQTGQAIEMLVIALAIYMALSLSVGALLNWYDARMKWVPL